MPEFKYGDNVRIVKEYPGLVNNNSKLDESYEEADLITEEGRKYMTNYTNRKIDESKWLREEE